MKGLDIILTAVASFILAVLVGVVAIPFLRKIKFGQPIIEEYGPTWHKKKQGTPTMGGFIFIIGSLVAVCAGFAFYGISLSRQGETPILSVQTTRLVLSVIMMVLFAFIGFVDDFIKVVKKHNAGLSEKQKFFGQVVVGVIYLGSMRLCGVLSTVIPLPFFGDVDFGWLYYPVCLLLIVFFVNAVNLTDGLDGLASSVTFFASIAFMIVASLLDARDVSLMATAVAAALIGFLLYNFYPAKVMMGDTGSLFLGGALVGMAFSLNQPFLLVLTGILYIIEALSVVIQVISFKTRKKRLFKMSPIHHHFELSGYSEVKIVALFSAVQIVGCILAVVWIAVVNFT